MGNDSFSRERSAYSAWRHNRPRLDESTGSIAINLGVIGRTDIDRVKAFISSGLMDSRSNRLYFKQSLHLPILYYVLALVMSTPWVWEKIVFLLLSSANAYPNGC